MDDFVAFTTVSSSSTHHTQSPKTRPNQINTITPNLHYPTSTNHNPTLSSPHFIHHYPNPIPHYILFTSPPRHSIHPSIHLSIHTHPCTNTYTLTRSIVNKLLTLYIYIDILTFMWYNQNNGKGAFLYVKYLTI